MSRADEFLRIYNELAKNFEGQLNATYRMGFSKMVHILAKRNSIIRTYQNDLRDYSDLRNAIVHHRTYPDVIIAEPTPQVLQKFRRIHREILKPRLVYPTFKRDVTDFDINTGLLTVIQYMKKNDYSQIIIRDSKDQMNLLTSEAVTRWLAIEAQAGTAVSVSNYKVGDALVYIDEGNMIVMPRDETVSKARDAFDNSAQPVMPQLCAIVITHSGRLHEKPLGIITPWDLLDEKNL
ncbi:MAG: hypothetical protein JW737_03060 [Acidobacteria bacterium]|nr:hypothetical protein [Acidobacteriota bacterium]